MTVTSATLAAAAVLLAVAGSSLAVPVNLTVKFTDTVYDKDGNVLEDLPMLSRPVWDVKGRMITPFMRKHGLTHERGWGRRAGELYGTEQDVGIDKCGKLAGFFVMPCTKVFNTPDGQPVSMVQTRHYHEGDFTYEIDTTYYVGDPDCTPAKSDVYYQTWMHGVVEFFGDNQIIKGTTRAALNWTDGQYLFGDNRQGQSLVANLNDHCSCGGKWEVGVKREVKGSECTVPIDDKAWRPCQIISGLVDYFNYQHHEDCRHYVTSADCFDDENTCWGKGTINGNYIREKIPESGNNHASDCDYKLWAKCGEGVKKAHDNCVGCSGLECDGCLFREMNPNWNPFSPAQDINDWYQCCPCIYYYAEKYGETEWMSTLC